MLRFYVVVAGFALIACSLIVLQWTMVTLRLPGRRRVAMAHYRALCRLLRVRLQVNGAPNGDGPLLIVANHASWVDIPAIASIMPLVFVAKREVRGWPLVGTAAALLDTIFVDRERRQQTAGVNAQIAGRMANGDAVVLFAEATSSDGNRVLQFRSALVGSAREVLSERSGGAIWLQPLAISYPGIDGLPSGRQHRPLVAWYGDTDFLPHLKSFVRLGAVDAVVTFGEPIAFDGGDRKAVTRRLEDAVRRMHARSLRGGTVRAA